MSEPPLPLLILLQRLIERSYDWCTGIEDLGPFLLGDEGYRRLYLGREILEALPGHPAAARTMVSWRGREIRLGLYYPDALIERLERENPLHRLNDGNIGPFAALVEELDHLLMLAWCARHGREVGLLELEFHANVTKYLVTAHFLARLSRRQRLSPEQRQWVRSSLFHDAGEGLPVPLRQRYRTAARLAVRILTHLEPFHGEDRVRALRRFARHSWSCQRSCLESPEPERGLGLLLGLRG